MGIMSSIFGSAKSNDVLNTSTSSYNSSDVYSTVDSHNVANNTSSNWSSNSTSNNTNTLTQDRRLVNDHGIGVSADNSTVWTADSNNNYTSTNVRDSNNVFTDSRQITNISTTDFGAVEAGNRVALAGIQSNQALAMKTVDAGMFLQKSASDMHQMNLTYSTHMADSAVAEARNAIREVTAATGNAMNQVVGLAAKPLTANDSQHVLVIVGLVVVGVVLFKSMGR
ncbi:MAG TPA: hypothetical protein VF800_11690 [Telluria sp.]|jgi:hypothetical protein